MNYLAHLFLSFEDPDLITGNFLGDMSSNQAVKAYPERIKKGIFLHRKIDTFTDAHPEVLKGVRRLYGSHSKYASVLIDVYYDYLLTLNWEQYSEVSLQDFADNVYEALLLNKEMMSDRIKRSLDGMVSGNWLISYSTLDGIEYAISRLARRVSKPELLEGAMDSLQENLELLNEEFNRFFPEVVAYVREEIELMKE